LIAPKHSKTLNPFPHASPLSSHSFSSHASIPNQAQLLSLPHVSYFNHFLGGKKSLFNFSLSLLSPTSIVLHARGKVRSTLFPLSCLMLPSLFKQKEKSIQFLFFLFISCFHSSLGKRKSLFDSSPSFSSPTSIGGRKIWALVFPFHVMFPLLFTREEDLVWLLSLDSLAPGCVI